mgnify:CR=1 FL=1|jgi:phosphomannomutase
MSINQIFKAYDVRGLYPQEINEDLALKIGNAFARAFGSKGKIVLGYDMRESSPAMAQAFMEGATTCGVDVVDIGLCSTDMLYYASGVMSLPGVMFTASHNGPEYNGIKMCREGASPIGSDSGLDELKLLIESDVTELSEQVGVVSNENILPDFVEHVLQFLDEGEKLSGLNVIADTANGMGGLVVPKVFEKLDAQIEIMYEELDGTFPNHLADPLNTENLNDLIAEVKKKRADVGLAFDGDADRVFLVDDNGDFLPGWVVVAIVASSLLKHDPKQTILHNLICSRRVPELIEELGGTAVRTKVGHSLIKKVMAETEAVFGGEHSGHYYFRDNYKADSGIIAALVVLQELKSSGVQLSTLRKEYEVYFQSGEINFTVEDKPAVSKKVLEHFVNGNESVKTDDLDGLTIEAEDWWFNLRPSNTEPSLRLNVEASSQQLCDVMVDSIRKMIG